MWTRYNDGNLSSKGKNKRKASVGDPAPSQQRVKMTSEGVTKDGQSKPKPKTTSAKPQPGTSDNKGSDDRGEGPSNTQEYLHCFKHCKIMTKFSPLRIRKSSRTKKLPARFDTFDTTDGMKQKEPQGKVMKEARNKTKAKK